MTPISRAGRRGRAPRGDSAIHRASSTNVAASSSLMLAIANSVSKLRVVRGEEHRRRESGGAGEPMSQPEQREQHRVRRMEQETHHPIGKRIEPEGASITRK